MSMPPRWPFAVASSRPRSQGASVVSRRCLRKRRRMAIARYMRVVSHIPAGSHVLEQYGTGAWRPVPARRDLILLAYPRTVGTDAAVVGPSSATSAARCAAPGDPASRPPGWRCGCVGGAPQRRCSLCEAAWWCTRCYAAECSCTTEVERRAASADEMSGVIDLCSPTASTPSVSDEVGVQPWNGISREDCVSLT